MAALALTPRQLAGILRVRADEIYYRGHDNTPGPTPPEQVTYGIIYEEYLELAKMLDEFAVNPGPFMSKAAQLKKEENT